MSPGSKSDLDVPGPGGSRVRRGGAGPLPRWAPGSPGKTPEADVVPAAEAAGKGGGGGENKASFSLLHLKSAFPG